MPKPYGQEAIDLCRSLYCKYGGKNHDAIQVEMRKAGYAGWQKSNLNDRGKGNARMGWITKYGFEESLKLHLQLQMVAINDDDQALYLEVKSVRETLAKIVSGKNATKDDRYLHRDYVKLQIEVKKSLEIGGANFETFAADWELILEWLAVIDPSGQAVKVLVKYSEALTERAQIHYGESEKIDGGTIAIEDAGGDAESGRSGR